MRFLLLLILIPSVVALTPLEAGTMEARVLILNEIVFADDGPSYYVKEATGDLTWFPRDDALQDIISLDAGEDGTQSVDSIHYKWSFPDPSEEIKVESVIKTRNVIVPIRKEYTFPLESVPPEVSIYLSEQEIIDQSPEIQKLAQELVSDADGLYEAVFNLADWTTTNIQYSLASLSEPAIQKSSEVLASRWGKCDELTALFISLNRAVGIPARFVAGYSYTNSQLLQQEWGGHGWSEVWFPDVGWVPFDVTYGEYGYLDAGHVKLKVAPDAKETSVDYSARGRDFTIQTESLDVFVTPTELALNSDKRLDISLEAPYSKVGFGSAVLILATVQNLKDYYVATRLDLAQTTNTEMLSDTYKNVMLKPRQTITVPFLIRIEDDLDRNFRYEFPFKLLSRLGGEESITIDVSSSGKIYKEEEFGAMMKLYLDDPASSPLFSVMCDRAPPVYSNSQVTHSCSVDGRVGDTITICKDTCEDFPVTGSSFSIVTSKPEGIFTEKYTAKQFGGSSDFFVTTQSLAKTAMTISLDLPAEALLEDTVFVRVGLEFAGATPKDIAVKTDVSLSTSTQLVEDMPANLELELPGEVLRPGENELVVSVSWTDELGTPGSASASGVITLTDATFSHKMKYFFYSIAAWFGDFAA